MLSVGCVFPLLEGTSAVSHGWVYVHVCVLCVLGPVVSSVSLSL